MQCARCRNEIPAHSRFCLSCGQPVQAAPPPRTVMPPTPFAPAGFAPGPAARAPAPALPARRPIGPLIACIAVLLVAVATLGTFLTMHSLAAAGRAAKN